MSTSHHLIHALSETTAIRLYNSVVVTDDSNDELPFVGPPAQSLQQNSLASLTSSGEFSYSCRICRWNRSDMELKKCPCLCKGSVGFIHLPCLKRWIMHRRDNHCEICNASFEIPEEKLSIRRMFKSFFYHCAWPILKQTLFGVSLLPLSNIILQQVVRCIDNINANPNEELTLAEVALATSALITSSAIFFNFFEFITTRLILIRNIIRHWWVFGNSQDFGLIHMESEIFDLFN